MTTPNGTPWPLRPVLRLAATAMIFAVGAYMSTGMMQTILMVCSVGLAVVAAVKLAKHMRRPG